MNKVLTVQFTFEESANKYANPTCGPQDFRDHLENIARANHIRLSFSSTEIPAATISLDK